MAIAQASAATVASVALHVPLPVIGAQYMLFSPAAEPVQVEPTAVTVPTVAEPIPVGVVGTPVDATPANIRSK